MKSRKKLWNYYVTYSLLPQLEAGDKVTGVARELYSVSDKTLVLGLFVADVLTLLARVDKLLCNVVLLPPTGSSIHLLRLPTACIIIARTSKFIVCCFIYNRIITRWCIPRCTRIFSTALVNILIFSCDS